MGPGDGVVGQRNIAVFAAPDGLPGLLERMVEYFSAACYDMKGRHGASFFWSVRRGAPCRIGSFSNAASQPYSHYYNENFLQARVGWLMPRLQAFCLKPLVTAGCLPAPCLQSSQTIDGNIAKLAGAVRYEILYKLNEASVQGGKQGSFYKAARHFFYEQEIPAVHESVL